MPYYDTRIENLPQEVEGIPISETIEKVFSDPANGKPDDINQRGCLELALISNQLGGKDKGHLVWNAWREAFPVLGMPATGDLKNHSQFAETNFQQLKKRIHSFACFKFANDADFSGADFGHRFNFQNAHWGHRANFDDAKWGNFCNFGGAYWADGARFRRCQFGVNANFKCAHWGVAADFRGARWGHDAKFCGAQWDADADFRGAQWTKHADFTAAQWDKDADFRGASWDGFVKFKGAQWGRGVNFCDTHWGGRVDFSAASWEELRPAYSSDQSHLAGQAWAKARGLSPESLNEISFQRALFLWNVSFENRIFRAQTDFSRIGLRQRVVRDKNNTVMFDALDRLQWEDAPDQGQFSTAPKFHGCEIHQDTSFEGAVFPPATGSEGATNAYRTLKLAFSKHQADSDEQIFFRLEQAEKAMTHRKKAWQLIRHQRFSCRNLWLALLEESTWLLYKFYDCTSAYGSSVLRPFILWIILTVISSGLYGEPPKHEVCFILAQSCTMDLDSISLSLSHSVPFGELVKVNHGPYDLPHVIGMVLHKGFAFVFLFLMGLALRNRFKLK